MTWNCKIPALVSPMERTHCALMEMSRSWPLDGSANNCRLENGRRKCFKKVSIRHWKLLLNIDQKSDTWKISSAPKLKILWKKQNLGILVRVKKERSWSDSLGALEIIIQTSPPPQPPAATRPTAQRLYKAHFIFSCLIRASVVNTSDKEARR